MDQKIRIDPSESFLSKSTAKEFWFYNLSDNKGLWRCQLNAFFDNLLFLKEVQSRISMRWWRLATRSFLISRWRGCRADPPLHFSLPSTCVWIWIWILSVSTITFDFFLINSIKDLRESRIWFRRFNSNAYWIKDSFWIWFKVFLSFLFCADAISVWLESCLANSLTLWSHYYRKRGHKCSISSSSLSFSTYRRTTPSNRRPQWQGLESTTFSSSRLRRGEYMLRKLRFVLMPSSVGNVGIEK